MSSLGLLHVRVFVVGLAGVVLALLAVLAYEADRRDASSTAQRARVTQTLQTAQIQAADATSSADRAVASAAADARTRALARDSAADETSGSTARDSGQLASLSQDTTVDTSPTPQVTRQMTVEIPRDLTIRSRPGGGAVVGSMPARSKYLGTPMRAWVLERSADGHYGLVTVPWGPRRARGWIRLDGLQATTTPTMVRVSLERREITVLQNGKAVLRIPAAIGASNSPSPIGAFFVTDLVSVPASQPQFGSFAFGLSAVQPNPPPGWTGGNQMAIHGTSAPASIGTPASAGCLRVSESSLRRLRGLLRLGTPVYIGR